MRKKKCFIYSCGNQGALQSLHHSYSADEKSGSEFMSLARGHIANKRQSGDLNPDF